MLRAAGEHAENRSEVPPMRELQTPSPRARRSSTLAALFVGLALAVSACSGSPSPQPSGTTDAVDAAKAQVDAAKQSVKSAEKALEEAGATFCSEAKDYVVALDRYGKLWSQNAATVGDVQTLGADLEQPRASVQTAAQGVHDARAQLDAANQDLADARNQLALAKHEAKVSANPSTTAKPSPSASPSPLPTLPTASIERVQQAESDLQAASGGITPQTPLRDAAESFTSAAFALQVAWLNLIVDAGCLTDEQAKEAAKDVRAYTTALQQNLKTAGYYDGEVDGVYGPKTVQAVEDLQKDVGLPVTGLVDQATSAALDAKVAEVEGANAAAQSAQTVAVQTTLTLAGYWDGPLDGNWTPELTAALKQFQSDHGLEPTGAVDAATLALVEELELVLPSPSPTGPPATTAPATTAPTTATTTTATTTAPTTSGGTSGPTTS